MKKVMKLALVAALVMSSTSLFAQKFGRINTQEVISEMAETKEMMTNLQAYAKDLQDNAETISVELNTKGQEYQKNFNTYSPAVRDMKEKELQSLNDRLQEFQQVAQQDYQKKQSELTAPIIEKAKAAIDKVASANGYTVVFDTAAGALAYFNEATLPDIAPEVKKELGIGATPAAAPAAATAAKK